MVDHLNDVKYVALANLGFTAPQVSERWLGWLQSTGVTSNQVTDAEHEFLTSQGVAEGQLNVRWYEWLGSLGYTGNLMERWYGYWLNGGGGGDTEEHFIVDENANFLVDEAGNFIVGIQLV